VTDDSPLADDYVPRKEVQEQVVQRLDRDDTLVHIAGQPGVGKTYLLNWVEGEFEEEYAVERVPLGTHHSLQTLTQKVYRILLSDISESVKEGGRELTGASGSAIGFGGGLSWTREPPDWTENPFEYIEALDEMIDHVPDDYKRLICLDDIHNLDADEQKIKDAVGLDTQILGIGRTGHTVFNEPGPRPDSRTRPITLDRITRKDAASDFFGEEHVPRRAITMGIGTILEADRIFMMAWGEGKAPIIREAVEGPVHERVPATYLQQHPEEWKILDRLCDITISKFFRDREVWEFLRGQILSALCQKKSGPVLIWSAGCCNGEEPYTIAMICEQLSKTNTPGNEFSILATDRNPEVLKRAKAGLYPAGALKELADEESKVIPYDMVSVQKRNRAADNHGAAEKKWKWLRSTNRRAGR
jgi:hypothetical protein